MGVVKWVEQVMNGRGQVGGAGDEWAGQGIPGNNRDAVGVLFSHSRDPAAKKICRPPDGQAHGEANHLNDGDCQDIALSVCDGGGGKGRGGGKGKKGRWGGRWRGEGRRGWREMRWVSPARGLPTCGPQKPSTQQGG